MSGAVQLSMFGEAEAVDTLDARLWRGSFNARDNRLLPWRRFTTTSSPMNAVREDGHERPNSSGFSSCARDKDAPGGLGRPGSHRGLPLRNRRGKA